MSSQVTRAGATRIKANGDEVALIVRQEQIRALLWLLNWLRLPALEDVRNCLQQFTGGADGQG